MLWVFSKLRQPRAVMMSALFDEFKRRKVVRIGIMYLVLAWLLIQLGSAVFEPLSMPEGALGILIITLLAGFPLVVALDWIFDWTS